MVGAKKNERLDIVNESEPLCNELGFTPVRLNGALDERGKAK